MSIMCVCMHGAEGVHSGVMTQTIPSSTSHLELTENKLLHLFFGLGRAEQSELYETINQFMFTDHCCLLDG